LTRDLYQLPTLSLNPKVKDIFAFTFEDISVNGYESHPAIKAKVAV
jgi:thymidylate synthase